MVIARKPKLWSRKYGERLCESDTPRFSIMMMMMMMMIMGDDKDEYDGDERIVGSWPAQVLALLRRQQTLPSGRHQIHLLCLGIVDS